MTFKMFLVSQNTKRDQCSLIPEGMNDSESVHLINEKHAM